MISFPGAIIVLLGLVSLSDEFLGLLLFVLDLEVLNDENLFESIGQILCGLVTVVLQTLCLFTENPM